MSVAVVGAGISGLACARALTDAGLAVRVLDRGLAPGGRICSPTVAGRPVDLGASYLTAREPEFVAVVEDWLARGLARPWTDRFHTATPAGLGELTSGPLRYGAAGGLRSLVADLAAGLPVESGVEVRAVTRAGSDVQVDGRAYDAVVLALPDPQAARLLAPELQRERAVLAGRPWQPVLALAAGFPERTWYAGFDGCFVSGSDVLGWVADDGRRRSDGAPVLVAHSTSSYATAGLEDPDAAGPAMVAELRTVLGLAAAPVWTRMQRWSHARPAGPREEPHWLGEAGVGLCGDGWGRPRVEAAWLSGHRLGRALAARLS